MKVQRLLVGGIMGVKRPMQPVSIIKTGYPNTRQTDAPILRRDPRMYRTPAEQVERAAL